VPADRFERFTERAKNVLVLAQEEAHGFGHNYIGTEHLLLGLIREGEGIAAGVLKDLGVGLEQAREAVEHVIGRGDREVRGDISLTPRSKKVIELAFDEARRLSHGFVGTEHLLLGLVREGEGIAAGILVSLGADLQDVSRDVLRVLAGVAQPPEALPTRDTVVSCRVADADLAAIDMLVEAGIRGTRSEAVQWLVHAGITAHKELFAKVQGTVGEIRRLRDEARLAAWQVAGDGESLLSITSSEERPPGGQDAGGGSSGPQA
jgi:ATP-dependent Clp protease ATP-binding subunit ClpA